MYALSFFPNQNGGMHYNPFAYIHSEKDILKLVTTLITNTKSDGKGGDPFWEKAEMLLYTALISYIHYEAPVEEQNFVTRIEFINAMEVREDDEDFENPVDRIFKEQKRKARQRPRDDGNFSLFAGLIKYGECGKALTIRKTNAKQPKDIYACWTYNRYGKHHCTQHRIECDVLYDMVHSKIQECAAAALADDEEVLDQLSDSFRSEQEGQLARPTPLPWRMRSRRKRRRKAMA